jgi:hypothetical protein
MHASTTAKTIFRNLTISGIFPCEIETRLFFGSKRDESASTRQTYPYEVWRLFERATAHAII